MSLCFMYIKVTGPHCPRHRNLAQETDCRLAAKAFCVHYYWQQFSLAEDLSSAQPEARSRHQGIFHVFHTLHYLLFHYPHAQASSSF